ncbi:hypothetical protein ACLKA6_015681 [Drosophila palustris]
MTLLYLSLSRCISLLLLLLLTAAPLRPAPIEAAEGAERALATWLWPVEMEKTSYQDMLDGGSPLPKIETEEMMPELGNALTQPFNFPLLPLPLNKGRNLWHQRYNKHLKALQVHQTWVGDPQSPAVIPKNRGHKLLPPNDNDAYLYDKPKELYKYKREPSEYKGPLYRPSISAGVMTNLGEFFKQLEANVQFAEHSQQLGEGESQLLEGLHPYSQLEQSPDSADDADFDSGQPTDRSPSKLLQSVRSSYRPSQKIRSLVSRNPNGYRGSQFIDPSYMWLGLGK